jgi:hypothetical protein
MVKKRAKIKQLSKAEIHWVQTNPEGLTVEDLARELECHVDIVKQFIIVPKKSPGTAGFVQRGGSTVMTPAAAGGVDGANAPQETEEEFRKRNSDKFHYIR